MDLNVFAKEVHRNAVAHGWWETERDPLEIIALIHSEWSEALEEFRAGRPMIWFECADGVEAALQGCGINGVCEETHLCAYRKSKPEGIAVELIDGCIRILDLIGYIGIELKNGDYGELTNTIRRVYKFKNIKQLPFPMFITNCHFMTAKAGESHSQLREMVSFLEVTIGQVFCWIEEQGLNPRNLMIQKHEYNKTRPYRHGNKVC